MNDTDLLNFLLLAYQRQPTRDVNLVNSIIEQAFAAGAIGSIEQARERLQKAYAVDQVLRGS
jgi:hypothetical protein